MIRDAIESIRSRIPRLQQQLDRLRSRHFPTEAPRRLLHDLCQVVESALGLLLETEEELDSLQDSDIHVRIRRAWILLAHVHEYLPWVETSALERAPFELGPVVERMARTHLGKTDVSVRTDPIFNYSVIDLGTNIAKLLAATGVTPIEPRRTLFISVPTSEASSVLLHPLVGHELGHQIATTEKLVERVYSALTWDPAAVLAVIEARIKPVADSDQPNKVGRQETFGEWARRGAEVQVRRDLEQVTHSWLEELLSDAIGTCFFGEAFLNALLDFSALPMGGSASHPPTELRLQVISRVMDRIDYPPPISKHIATWIMVGSKPIPGHTRAKLIAIVEDAVRAEVVLEAIVETVIKVLGDAAVLAPTYARDLAELEEQMKFCIPPNEIFDSSTSKWRSGTPRLVFNCICRFWYQGCPGWDRWNDQEKLTRLNHIGLKALELVELTSLAQERGSA